MLIGAPLEVVCVVAVCAKQHVCFVSVSELLIHCEARKETAGTAQQFLPEKTMQPLMLHLHVQQKVKRKGMIQISVQ